MHCCCIFSIMAVERGVPMNKRDKIIHMLLGKTVHVEIDRPVGYQHKGLTYPINYGYIPGTVAGDGEAQDAYILGVAEPRSAFDGRVIAVIRRKDDCENKLVVAPEGAVFTRQEIADAVAFQEQYFDSTVITTHMQRILIVGNAGAGKTTFARQLAQKTGLHLVHLDRLFWHGNWQQLDRAQFDALLQKELERPEWIIDGNFSRTLPHRLQYCDTLFFFDLPTITCLAGITQRIFAYWGKTRPDMGGSCPERFDKQKLSLYRGVLTYNRRHRKNYIRLFHEQAHAQVIVFKSRRQAKAFLDAL